MNQERVNPFNIPGFDPIEFIGEGGFGEVYLMREQSKLGMPRAVKVLNVHPFNDAKYAEERFEREAKSIAKLKHTSIVGYIASGFTNDDFRRPYIVMEFVKGDKNLSYISTLQFVERVRLFTRILDALSYAHTQDVLHRDLKPANIIVRESDSNPVVVDFGLAYLFEDESKMALTKSRLGTPGYIPQEVIINPQDRKVTHDIFSCGVVLYEILAGKMPDIQNYTDVSIVANELAGLDRIVRKAIAPIKDRYQTISQFKNDLEDWIKLAEERENLAIVKTDFREKLLEKKKKYEEIKKKDELNRRQMLDALHEAHRMVYAASEVAFRQVSSTLMEVYEHYNLVSNGSFGLPNLESNQGRPLFTIEFKNGKLESRNSISFIPFNPRRKETHPARHFNWSTKGERHTYLPYAWVIWQEGNSQSPNSFTLASIVPVLNYHPSGDKLKYTLHGQATGNAILSATLKPRPLRTTTEIQSFVVEILEKRYEGY